MRPSLHAEGPRAVTYVKRSARGVEGARALTGTATAALERQALGDLATRRALSRGVGRSPPAPHNPFSWR